MEHADLTPGSPSVPVTRAFRQLASTLNERPSATPVVVTSSGAGEGKSTVAVHLSDALVTADRTVCIVDLNFRRPVIHKLFALDNNGGVTDIISGAIGLEDGLQDTRTPNLFVLTAGTECREREQFLTASALDTLLSSLASRVDQIVIDTPHLLDGPLAATAAQPGTSVVVVVRHLQERVQSLTAAIARLEDPSVVQGFVRNGV